MEYIDLGNIEYAEAWKRQEVLFNASLHAKHSGLPTSNSLLFCEHPHVITIGKSGKSENLLFSEELLKQRGVSLFRTDRGGDVTYHGPGQLVGYPIFDLEIYNIGLKQYVHCLEEVMIRLLAQYNIKGEHLHGATGVWLDTNIPQKTRKIAAIGVRCSRYITMHGFALNVNTDLSYFSLINPCGFIDKGVTSIQKELGETIDMESLKHQTRLLFENLFIANKYLA